MKPTIRAPYFEVGTKNYVYGDTLLVSDCRNLISRL